MTSYPSYWPRMGVLAFLVTFAASGCGSGEQSYRLTGTVTFKGQPVPDGQIIFEPDSAQGNSGAPGVAKIKAGKYDTGVEGQGIIGGPHKIMITGFDGPVGKAEGTREVNLPNQLFPPYSTTADLPKENGTMDFPIPEK